MLVDALHDCTIRAPPHTEDRLVRGEWLVLVGPMDMVFKKEEKKIEKKEKEKSIEEASPPFLLTSPRGCAAALFKQR